MHKPKPDSLDLYLTQPGPCPYLEGQTEQKVITMLDDASAPLAPLLVERGFRRMQKMFYRQQCPACRACIATRIRLADFRPEKKFGRILKRNAGLTARVERTAASEENYALFRAYLDWRHAGGEMAKMSYADFRTMMEEYPAETRFLICRDGAATLGIMLFDELPDGTSAVYSFFSPAHEKRSLGTWMILKLAEYTLLSGRPFLYLGFWIRESPKMAYKAKFQPLELFEDEGWSDFGGTGGA
jgi:arginine-tRNA-protein transferase